MSDSSLIQSGLPGPSTVLPNDLPARLINATEAIRDHLTAKMPLDETHSHALSVVENVLDPHREEPDANLERRAHNSQIPAVATSHGGIRPGGWFNADQIQVYIEICTKHNLKCQITRESLRCFIAHLIFLGGDEVIIYEARRVVDKILDPMERLQIALTKERAEEVKDSFDRLDISVRNFRDILDQNYNGSLQQVGQWKTVLANGLYRMSNLVQAHEDTKCLEYIFDTFLPELEAVMDVVCEEFAAFEETSTDDWLAKQNYKIPEEWRTKNENITSPTSGFRGSQKAWPKSEKQISDWKVQWPERKRVWDTMSEEMGNLIAHYKVVGGDEEVIKSTKVVQKILRTPIIRLGKLLYSPLHQLQVTMAELKDDIKNLWLVVSIFKGSLYHQKHAFYFREVQKWVTYLRNGFYKIHGFLEDNELDACLVYICNDLFVRLEKTMVGAVNYHNSAGMNKVESDQKDSSTGSVAQELKIFGERSLPTFVANEMERDTTRFVNITTIATFFSSVTATTLQFTYQPLGDETSEPLRGVVNLFWFVSLVFSVSSGVSSLLGLTWRKSSIYDSRRPPMLIHLWFDKAPMVSLFIAAVAFVIGLNLFAYLSVQHRYVSIATHVFTGLHGICLIGVTAWFIYHLKHESLWARWIRTLMGWIGGLSIWKWIRTWAGKVETWVGDTCRATWTWIRHPRQEYRKKKLHLKRNLFWAFGFDNRVAQLNVDMEWVHDWPGPYVLSKIVRFIAYPTKKVWIGSNKALSSIIHSVKRRIRTLFHTGDVGLDPGDDSGKRENAGKEKLPTWEEAEEDSVKKAANAYCAVLREVFHKDWIEGRVVRDIEIWQGVSELIAENYIKRELWGYPDLVRRFHEDVRPVLVEVRDNPRKASGGGKGKGRAREPEDIGWKGSLDFDLTGGQPEVRMRPDSQESTESQHQAPSALTRAEGSGRGGVPEIWGGTDGAKEDRSEQADVEIPGGTTSERSANEPSSGPSKSIGEAEKGPGSPVQLSVDPGHAEIQPGVRVPIDILPSGKGGYPEVGTTTEHEEAGYLRRSGAPEPIGEADGLEGIEESPRIADNEEADKLRSSEAAERLG